MFDDLGHRPHADHRGEEPETKFPRGPQGLSVQLVKWEPKEHVAYVYNALQANWGEHPSRIKQLDGTTFWDEDENRALVLDEAEAIYEYVAKCFAGGTLPQILEEFRFHFVIDGVTRACTHQLVRTRGADVMQHGGRDNDWRHRNWTMPETIWRVAKVQEALAGMADGTRLSSDLVTCVTDWHPINKYLEKYKHRTLRFAVEEYIRQGKELYSALVDAGIPWQDARRVLHMGTQTYLHIGYNYLDLQRTLANRLEHIMDWEYNCVAQLMVREVRMVCPEYMWEPLKSASDKAEKAAFAGLTSWPPDGKYPVPFEYQNLPRTHRPEQMPYWVLSKESMDGGPIRWIPTNGTFPEGAR